MLEQNELTRVLAMLDDRPWYLDSLKKSPRGLEAGEFGRSRAPDPRDSVTAPLLRAELAKEKHQATKRGRASRNGIYPQLVTTACSTTGIYFGCTTTPRSWEAPPVNKTVEFLLIALALGGMYCAVPKSSATSRPVIRTEEAVILADGTDPMPLCRPGKTACRPK